MARIIVARRNLLATGACMALVFTLVIVGRARSEAGPTTESALTADQGFAKAMQENDADGIAGYLTEDWAVVTGNGDVAEGKSVFPSGIKSGYLTRTKYETSDPRVRLYGNTALVTTQVKLSGVIGGKPFADVEMRQTNIWIWKDGGWKCVLTHETLLKK